MRVKVVITILFSVASVVFGAENQPWYAKKLMPKDKYFADFALKPGESHGVQIKTDKELRVMFIVDSTREQDKKYGSSANPYPIVMEQMGAHGGSVASLVGAGAEYTPVNGVIDLTIKNTAKEDSFRIVIVTREGG